ncbi:TerD family protein [Streptomyces sp. NPDC006294]|uniref:TerD family protein n=1 Tax=Streptomyces sp. NPDC006294 TaxID=3364743 RepID=UPI0036B9AF93
MRLPQPRADGGRRPAGAGHEDRAELYRRGSRWRFRAVGQGYDHGLAALARGYGGRCRGLIPLHGTTRPGPPYNRARGPARCPARARTAVPGTSVARAR